jgi:hypothetical protein
MAVYEQCDPLPATQTLVRLAESFKVSLFLPNSKLPIELVGNRKQSVAEVVAPALHERRINWQKNTVYLLYTGIAVTCRQAWLFGSPF